MTSRLGEGKKLTKVEWCLAGSVHLLAHPWGIISFLFLLGEYLVRAWLDFRVDDSFNASFIRCCCLPVRPLESRGWKMLVDGSGDDREHLFFSNYERTISKFFRRRGENAAGKNICCSL